MRNNSNYTDNLFEETFNKLFYAGKMYTKNGKDSYYTNDIVNIVETQDDAKLKKCLVENDGQDLIIMLKNIMLTENLNNEKIMEDLRNEVKQNNSVVDRFLDTLSMKEKQCNLLIETMLT